MPAWVTVAAPEPATPQAPETAARPVVSDLAERLYAALCPMQDGDADHGWILLSLCDALTSPIRGLDEVLGADGWRTFLDVDQCPADAVAWLGQFVGVTVPPGASTAAQRDLVRAHTGWSRGTPAAIVAAATAWLGGTRQVTLTERVDADPYAADLAVYAAEVLDEAQLRAAVAAVKPAGLVLTITIRPGRTFAEAEAEYAGLTFAEVEALVAPATFAEEERKVPS